MKKRFFNLQLFAEPATDPVTTDPAANVATEPGNTTGDNKPAPATEPKKDEPKYTDADFDRKLNQKFAEWQQKKDKEINEAKKLAEMNAQEKAEYSLKQEQEAHAATQKELDALKRKDTLAEMSKTARKMLSDEGINIPDELLSLIVTTDAEETKTAVSGFSKLFKAAVEAAAKENARGTTPKLITNNGDALSEIDKRIAKYE